MSENKKKTLFISSCPDSGLQTYILFFENSQNFLSVNLKLAVRKLIDNSIDIGEGPVRRGNGNSVYFQDPDCNHLEIHCDDE